MTASHPATVYVARQPILDRHQNVCAYELLFRSDPRNAYEAADQDIATLDVITNSFLIIGLDELTSGRPAFINFTRHWLVQDLTEFLPPGQVTVEILEDVEPDQEVLAACRRLSAAGYVLALDDFVLSASGTPLLDVADIVKVDFLGTTVEERTSIARDLRRRGISLLAEKVESREEFEQGVSADYSYFQGYFFAKPVIRSGRRIPESKLTLLRLLQEIHQPDLAYDRIEAIVKEDLSLTYKLLRLVNSSRFGLRGNIRSIQQALVLLGAREIRQWCSLLGLRAIGSQKPEELLRIAITRGRMAERLAPLVGFEAQASQLLLMGMFSVLDAILDAPMPEILERLPLDEMVKLALLGHPSRFKTILELTVAYERGDWATFSAHAESLHIEEDAAARLLCEALHGILTGDRELDRTSRV
jgi:EAL and modified HD-GYP domain-containing signal transduction protein